MKSKQEIIERYESLLIDIDKIDEITTWDDSDVVMYECMCAVRKELEWVLKD